MSQPLRFAAGPFGGPGEEAGPERREHPRLALELDVSRSAEEPVFVGFTENLSESGFFLATHLPANVGEALAFAFHLPGTERAVTGLGEVRWTRVSSECGNIPPGVGVRFVSLEPGCLQAIREFLGIRR